MDKALLVDWDLQNGAEVVRILEHSGIVLDVAINAVLSEYGDWRLILASHRFDAMDPKDARMLIYEALDNAGFPADRTPSLLVFRMKDPFIRDLRRRYPKGAYTEMMRIGSMSFGDRFVEDGFVFRLTGAHNGTRRERLKRGGTK